MEIVSDNSSTTPTSSDQDEDSALTLVEALEEKYLCDEDVDSSILLTSVNPCKLASECALSLLVLDHRNICCIGDVEKFNTLAKNVVEVDVSSNRFRDWSEIAILLKLPKLNTLNIGYNPLDDGIHIELPVARNLTSLYLCGAHLSLSTILVLVRSMPVLRELYLSENNKVKNEAFTGDLQSLASSSVQTLHLIRCDINSWTTTVLLRHVFPACEYLVLCENPLKRVFFDDEAKTVDVFKGLRYLSLTGCLIDDWESIESLAEIETLRAMKLQHLPLLDTYSDEERVNLIIPRLPFLEELNGSPITEEHRITSERFFIRYYDVRDVKPKIFHTLVMRHGHVAQLCHLDLTPKRYVSVVVNCEEKGFKGTIKVPRAQSVSTFKRSLEKRLNIPVHQMRVFYMGPPDMLEVFIAQELRLPSSKLSSLRVEDGDHFTVQTKCPAGRRTSSIKKQEVV